MVALDRQQLSRWLHNYSVPGAGAIGARLTHVGVTARTLSLEYPLSSRSVAAVGLSRRRSCWCKVAAVSGPLVAVITGASSGIGEATARRLAREPPTAGEAVSTNGSAGHAATGAGSQLVLVARREGRLRALAETLPAPCSWLALDLTDEDAPARVLAHVQEHCGGPPDAARQQRRGGVARALRRGRVRQRAAHDELNFDAPVRLTEALLPLLRACAPSAIVNVSSTAARVARPRHRLVLGEQVRAHRLERRAVRRGARPRRARGLVFPGFIATEGFPARELTARPHTAWIVSTPDRVAEAIVEVGPGAGARALRAARPTASPAVRVCCSPASCAAR